MHEIRLATTLVHQYSLSNLDTMANSLYHVINCKCCYGCSRQRLFQSQRIFVMLISERIKQKFSHLHLYASFVSSCSGKCHPVYSG
jgi:hypothetical protein